MRIERQPGPDTLMQKFGSQASYALLGGKLLRHSTWTCVRLRGAVAQLLSPTRRTSSWGTVLKKVVLHHQVSGMPPRVRKAVLASVPEDDEVVGEGGEPGSSTPPLPAELRSQYKSLEAQRELVEFCPAASSCRCCCQGTTCSSTLCSHDSLQWKLASPRYGLRQRTPCSACRTSVEDN